MPTVIVAIAVPEHPPLLPVTVYEVVDAGESVIEFAKTLRFDLVTRPLITQLVRSATSVGANYMEANQASSKKDFINFFSYSLKSANETCFWLDILLDSGKCDKNAGLKLLKEAKELANILAASIITMKSSR